MCESTNPMQEPSLELIIDVNLQELASHAGDYNARDYRMLVAEKRENWTMMMKFLTFLKSFMKILAILVASQQIIQPKCSDITDCTQSSQKSKN